MSSTHRFFADHSKLFFKLLIAGLLILVLMLVVLYFARSSTSYQGPPTTPPQVESPTTYVLPSADSTTDMVGTVIRHDPERYYFTLALESFISPTGAAPEPDPPIYYNSATYLSVDRNHPLFVEINGGYLGSPGVNVIDYLKEGSKVILVIDYSNGKYVAESIILVE